MEIRLAQGSDLPGILTYDGHIPRARAEACLERQKYYVLSDGSRILGILRYSLFWQSIPFLDLLYLDENCRGRGYGTRMMAYWEAAMKDRGYSHGMLSTQEDETAKFFYEKLGYRPIGSFLPPDQEAAELMYLKTL